LSLKYVVLLDSLLRWPQLLFVPSQVLLKRKPIWNYAPCCEKWRVGSALFILPSQLSMPVQETGSILWEILRAMTTLHADSW